MTKTASFNRTAHPRLTIVCQVKSKFLQLVFSDGQSFQLILGASETWTLVLRKPGDTPQGSATISLLLSTMTWLHQPTIVVSGSGDANVPFLPASERILTAVGRGEALFGQQLQGHSAFFPPQWCIGV